MPLVSLEEAVAPLVSILPEVQHYASVAKQQCKTVPADGLTRDESASIILYTMDWKPHEECVYVVLNATLRDRDRQKLIPWFLYLNLIHTALAQLPSRHNFVYRGVKGNLSEKYRRGREIVWWGFSSCTSNLGVFENAPYFDKTSERTLFTIDCDSGKDISQHTYFPSEEEILLLPARQFVVIACLKSASDLTMIQLKEISSPIPLLQPVTVASKSSKPSSGKRKIISLFEVINSKNMRIS
ncbi:unnamed protein product [Rotaria sp. Silwood1]|nr:unnamed protein product [Rotaria sp. Silwood1]